jgi:hypothetical protein
VTVSTIQAGFGQTWTRATLPPLLLFLLLAAYVVPARVFATHSPQLPSTDAPEVWKAAYSERYPGCVADVLWPAGETPVAVVVLNVDGSTSMLSREEATQRAALGQVAHTIGACRTPD